MEEALEKKSTKNGIKRDQHFVTKDIYSADRKSDLVLCRC